MEETGPDPPPRQPSEHPMGEDSGMDMRRSFARHFNRLLRGLTETNPSSVMDLGQEHGGTRVDDILGARDDIKEGHLRVYIRRFEEGDPKIIVPTIIALGVVATGIYKLKHRKK